MIKILQKEAPILREIAQPVPVKEIRSKKIRAILSKMREAMHAEEDGVAIAAPQIGENLRIFIVNGEALAFSSKGIKSSRKQGLEDLVFINPEITKLSKKKRNMEEGCLSIRYLYGQVKRSEKTVLRAYNESGQRFERGASGLLAQIFQHEMDHLEGILFTDKAANIQEIPPAKKIKFVFFGSSQFSLYVLEELERVGLSPTLVIDSAKKTLPMEKLKKLEADVFVVASFGKILPKELLALPKHQTLNVHPSLLPQLRGASPIQSTILGLGDPGVTIIRMDEKMDHGPIIVQAKVSLSQWPEHYQKVEEKLARAGGQLLGLLLPKWVLGEIPEKPQDHTLATFTKLIQKEDGLLNLEDNPEINLRKILAYSTWPGAYFFFKTKIGKELRIVVKNAKIEDGKLVLMRIIPEGKKEMDWQDFLRGN